MTDKHSHYFDKIPVTAHDMATTEAMWEGVQFVFRTDSSVFSRHRVDPGTDLLVRTVLAEQKDRPLNTLDLGTGVGIMAIALAKLRPSFTVTGCDINSRAVELATHNAEHEGMSSRTRFVEADGVPGDAIFDLVLSNPPIRAGKETVYRLFRQVSSRLTPDGVFYVVIRVKQGAATAKRELQLYFEAVTTVARAKGYHILKACHPKHREEQKDE
ncbi:MAG: methyltransferase [Clostridiaceae bacterium]|jgi:16S rRNA (guanine1207-N2)-methyltransferase|nr:methyltransferase [Clostridiaceae bacterium]